MSKKYDLYLEEHKNGVKEAYNWLKTNLPELVEGRDNIEWLTCIAHDASKTNPDEYEAYDAYFYGGNRSFGVVEEFNKAWLKHIHRNPHHWQHWVLINDDPENGEIVLDMPYEYVIEMICDWWSFSFRQGNLREIFKWWEEHEKYIKLNKSTRKVVVDILAHIKNKLDELETGENNGRTV